MPDRLRRRGGALGNRRGCFAAGGCRRRLVGMDGQAKMWSMARWRIVPVDARLGGDTCGRGLGIH